MKPRVKPFPVNRLAKLSQAELDLLGASGSKRWLPKVTDVASQVARRLGLGAAQLDLARVSSCRVEDLRMNFPGNWSFAVLADPLADRCGLLALDPLLVGRLVAKMQPDRPLTRGALGRVRGEHGLLGWVLAAALDELAVDFEGLSNWRYFGLLESLGQVGRTLRQEDHLLCSFLKAQVGWDSGFAAWLEPSSSVRRSEASASAADYAPSHFSNRLPVRATWLVGTSQLSCAEIQDLNTGDIVLLSEEDLPQTGFDQSLVLGIGDFQLFCSRCEDAFRVESIIFNRGERPMDTIDIVTQQSQASLERIEPSQLPVILNVEAGRLDLTVEQVACLRVGDVLTMPQAVLGPVSLRADARLVAVGELVDVDGRRGVRVLEIERDREDEDQGDS